MRPAWEGRLVSRVLAEIARRQYPQVLDLGPLCGASVTQLARLGARVHVEPFEPPPPTPPRRPRQPPPPLVPLRIARLDASFDLVLAGEWLDFVPPDRWDDFGTELARVVRGGGWVVLFSRMGRSTMMDRPAAFRVEADGRLVRQAARGARRPRWSPTTREIERVLGAFVVEQIHLYRDQLREVVARRRHAEAEGNAP